MLDLVYSKANKRVVTCASIQVKPMRKIIQLDGVNVGGWFNVDQPDLVWTRSVHGVLDMPDVLSSPRGVVSRCLSCIKIDGRNEFSSKLAWYRLRSREAESLDLDCRINSTFYKVLLLIFCVKEIFEEYFLFGFCWCSWGVS